MTSKVDKEISVAKKGKDTKLDLSNRALREWPKELSTLSDLEELDVSNNQLCDLPHSIGELRSLSWLDVSSNSLDGLPSTIGKLKELRYLDASNNLITTLPREIENLALLDELNLNSNELKNFSLDIGRLSNLTKLHFLKNELEALPKGLTKLRRVRHICCEADDGSNAWAMLDGVQESIEEFLIVEHKIKRSELPEVVFRCRGLRELAVVDSGLRKLSPRIGELINLEELLLMRNKLEELPSEIGSLKRLSTLNVQGNRLRTLPVQLGDVEKLSDIDIGMNPLRDPPPEIATQGTAAILRYIRDQQAARDQQWISKLILLGEGGVGKTSLLRSLLGEPFDSELETTHGIDIRKLAVEHPDFDEVMSLNCWDFGGQHIYHATHQFFLTNRSLFILVWSARSEDQQGRLDYWLESINARAPDSPILIAATHADSRQARIAINELCNKYKQIRGLWSVSCKTEEGIEDLRAAITRYAAELPLMGEWWPKSWMMASEALRNKTEKAISPSELSTTLTAHNVPDDSQRTLIQYLHELGDILYFQDDAELDDLVILKPDWATEAISRVLESKAVCESQGIFSRQDMEKIWSDFGWAEREHFLRLMERFDLSYRTLEDRDVSLVVELLPLESPSTLEREWEEFRSLPENRTLVMRYRLDSRIPAGVPTWFIARSHRFTTRQQWTSGALFKDREEKHRALVTSSEHDRCLELQVIGPMPHNFFALLRDGLELTLARFPGLRIKRVVPCPGHDERDCGHEFDFRQLQKAAEQHPPVADIQCPESFKMVPISEMLFGISWREDNEVLNAISRLRNDNREEHIELVALMQREFANAFRRDQKHAESHCPSVFTLRPLDSSSWRDKFGNDSIELQLYCQAPGAWHPTDKGGSYSIDQPAAWLRILAPHLGRLVRLLQYATPLIGPVLGYAAPDVEKIIGTDIKLMDALVKKLPSHMQRGNDEKLLRLAYPEPQRMYGADLRGLRMLLDEVDPEQHWGGLQKTLTPEGHYLWLCKHHANEF